MSSFSQILYECLDVSSIGFYMIHLERASERIPDIELLERNLLTSLHRFPGADGVQLVSEGHPTKSIYGGTRTDGDVGCTVSHIRVCRDALEKGYSHVVIFEDDCQMTTTLTELNSVLQNAKKGVPQWDLLIMDGCYIEYNDLTDTTTRVKNFTQTHAVILNQTFMKELIALYEIYYKNNTIFAIDGIYSNVLKTTPCVGIGIREHGRLFRQKPGYSYILNSYRNH